MPFLVKNQESFEKSQENFSEKSGKIPQLDLWQPWLRSHTGNLKYFYWFFKANMYSILSKVKLIILE